MSDNIVIKKFLDNELLERTCNTFDLILRQTAAKLLVANILEDKIGLHQKILTLAKVNKKILTDAINVFTHSATFGAIFGVDQIDKIIKNLYPGANSNDLILIEKNFRVDLPESFKNEQKKYSLGWHQESGYFRDNVSHENGWVIWLPLFSCAESQGALILLPESSKYGKIEHNKTVLDKVNNRNIRMTISDKLIEKNKETRKVVEIEGGDCSAFKFNTVHCTGQNLDDSYARLTIQARVSLHSDKNFRSH